MRPGRAAMIALVTVGSLGGWVLGAPAGPAAASPTSTTKPVDSPIAALLPPSYVQQQLDFPTDAEGPEVTSRSRTAGCPVAAGEVFENLTGTISLGSEIVLCRSVKAATALRLRSVDAGQAWPGLNAPGSLGSTAAERLGSSSTYAIFWQRRYAVEVVAIDTDVTEASVDTGAGGAVPLTARQQAMLARAAQVQNARLRVGR